MHPCRSMQPISDERLMMQPISDQRTRHLMMQPISDQRTRHLMVQPISDQRTRYVMVQPISDQRARHLMVQPISDQRTRHGDRQRCYDRISVFFCYVMACFGLTNSIQSLVKGGQSRGPCLCVLGDRHSCMQQSQTSPVKLRHRSCRTRARSACLSLIHI